MKEFFNKYTTIGKIFTVLSLLIMLAGIVLTCIFNYKMLIVAFLIATTIDYMCIQYFSQKEYFEKTIGPRINKKSRNFFAFFLAFTTISISLGVLQIINSSIALYLTAFGLMFASIACVFNEYGIDGPKKKKGIISCIVVFVSLIIFVIMCKTQLGW